MLLQKLKEKKKEGGEFEGRGGRYGYLLRIVIHEIHKICSYITKTIFK